MAKRSYKQVCPIAYALDLVGERWTLLVVRELLDGPKRYSEIRRGLPGVPSDLLTERLRSLEEQGAITRRPLPPPSSAHVYELTERGRGLRPAIRALFQFGMELMPDPFEEGDDYPPLWRVRMMLEGMFDPDRAPAEPTSLVARSGGEELRIELGPDGLESAVSTADEPGEHEANRGLLLRVLSGEVDLDQALERRDFPFADQRASLERAIPAFSGMTAA